MSLSDILCLRHLPEFDFLRVFFLLTLFILDLTPAEQLRHAYQKVITVS